MTKKAASMPFATTPALIQVQNDYLEAKENIEGWEAQKDALRTNLFMGLEAMGLEWPEEGSVVLEKIRIGQVQKVTLDQMQILMLFQKFPAQAAAFFKIEYKLNVDRETLLKACEHPGDFGEALEECFELPEKEKRLYKRKK